MVTIKQSPKGDPFMNIKGTYLIITDGHYFSATVSCPSCGQQGPLINYYNISTDGVVSPDFECGYYCSFKSKIKLEAWSPITPFEPPKGFSHLL